MIAAMAATAAVRASSKLHTVMIRIAAQWLAACSVLTAFDLSQIPLEITEDSPLFPWPLQVALLEVSFGPEICPIPTHP